MYFQPYSPAHSVFQRKNILLEEAIPYSLYQNKNISSTLNQNEFVPYSLEKGKSTVLNEETAGTLNREIPGVEMNLAEQRMIGQLKAIDAEVRAHEHAHIAAAGGVATGGPTYVYVRGPDGKLYAVGGEVSITTAYVPGNPEQTIEKAQKIRRAALAPANPSPQDMRVAAAAIRMERQARVELNREKAAEKAEEMQKQEGLREQDQEDDVLYPRIEDIYTKAAAGITEESSRYIDILV
ncbi:MAG: hypothetical protein JXB88_26400 [Spirochaetales bacterium]|nr:hypothetical protein [Spirochaetales bacterium]